ncbi:hypothetical protein TNCT_536711 [Trichonephila clavata]|uniref:Uncharacterized protein n=1 Tax=Trichonephila clavata TaxID=2740835 RepID=A0A8X6L3Z1_TRICU|nr:hypothetical protein TNCT_536711 [Trichonephila clavata]
MKFALILFFAVLAVAYAQRPELCKGRVPCKPRRPARPLIRIPIIPVRRYGLGDDDQYFASLGGADVGRYRNVMDKHLVYHYTDKNFEDLKNEEKLETAN